MNTITIETDEHLEELVWQADVGGSPSAVKWLEKVGVGTHPVPQDLQQTIKDIVL